MASIILSFPDGRILPSDIIDTIFEFLRYSPFQYASDKDKRRNKTVIDKKTGKRVKNKVRVCSHCSAIKLITDSPHMSKVLIKGLHDYQHGSCVFVDFCCSKECCLERSKILVKQFYSRQVIRPISDIKDFLPNRQMDLIIDGNHYKTGFVTDRPNQNLTILVLFTHFQNP